MSEELTRAGNELRAALAERKAAAIAAKKAGMSEVKIAAELGVSRHTVRAWLGKPRKR